VVEGASGSAALDCAGRRDGEKVRAVTTAAQRQREEREDKIIQLLGYS
jgi:hypothetical protein